MPGGSVLVVLVVVVLVVRDEHLGQRRVERVLELIRHLHGDREWVWASVLMDAPLRTKAGRIPTGSRASSSLTSTPKPAKSSLRRSV